MNFFFAALKSHYQCGCVQQRRNGQFILIYRIDSAIRLITALLPFLCVYVISGRWYWTDSRLRQQLKCWPKKKVRKIMFLDFFFQFFSSTFYLFTRSFANRCHLIPCPFYRWNLNGRSKWFESNDFSQISSAPGIARRYVFMSISKWYLSHSSW